MFLTAMNISKQANWDIEYSCLDMTLLTIFRLKKYQQNLLIQLHRKERNILVISGITDILKALN